MSVYKIENVYSIDPKEEVLWEEDTSFLDEDGLKNEMTPKEQIIALVFCTIFLCFVAWIVTLCIEEQWIVWTIYGAVGIFVSVVGYLLYLTTKTGLENSFLCKASKDSVCIYTYFITDKAVYCRIGSSKNNPFKKFYFEDIDTIYTYTSNTNICIGRYKNCDEEDMSLKNVKGFNTALTLLKEKTGIEPELVHM